MDFPDYSIARFLSFYLYYLLANGFTITIWALLIYIDVKNTKLGRPWSPWFPLLFLVLSLAWLGIDHSLGFGMMSAILLLCGEGCLGTGGVILGPLALTIMYGVQRHKLIKSTTTQGDSKWYKNWSWYLLLIWTLFMISKLYNGMDNGLALISRDTLRDFLSIFIH